MNLVRLFDSEFIDSKRMLNEWCGGRSRNRLYSHIEAIVGTVVWNSVENPKAIVRANYQRLLTGFAIGPEDRYRAGSTSTHLPLDVLANLSDVSPGLLDSSSDTDDVDESSDDSDDESDDDSDDESDGDQCDEVRDAIATVSAAPVSEVAVHNQTTFFARDLILALVEERCGTAVAYSLTTTYQEIDQLYEKLKQKNSIIAQYKEYHSKGLEISE